MSTQTYRKKRDFDKTPEPKSSQSKQTTESNKRRFVIQKHDASRLHYDFRLEINDALTSWAVPKGLSTAANKKRLAIRTEDHPLDYIDFEGVIPEDQYGGGTVMIWDTGTYEPLIDSDEHEKPMAKALKDGALKFSLHGEKLKGGYAMAKTSDKDDDEEQWVIFKLDDGHADARRNSTSTANKSVKTGRTLEEITKEEGGKKT